ncbi:MAG: fatty acid desaturase [Bacteroidales bacterium]|nr:fatty acid desaturase [Bacteroidales bacterium]
MENNQYRSKTSDQDWIKVVGKYNKPDIRKSIWQIVNSLIPYIVLWYLMYLSLEISYFLTLGLSILAAGFLVRIFIIFHDCGHGAFFKSKKTNKIIGTFMGSLVFTPYDRWHKDHAIHHSNVGNLDERGIGDVMTLTVEEYKKLKWGKKLYYRLYRNPAILFGVAPILLFVVWFRFILKSMTRNVRNSVHISNLIIVALAGGLILLMGWKAFLLIQLPVIYIATSVGVWLFYVQHQFDGVIWTRDEEWDYMKMALEGSSYLKLPKVLQWFSGNIGFHHIHHLSPKIPNYNLEKCHKENSIFDSIKPLTFLPAIRTMNLKLWDEKLGKLITIRQYKKMAGSYS